MFPPEYMFRSRPCIYFENRGQTSASVAALSAISVMKYSASLFGNSMDLQQLKRIDNDTARDLLSLERLTYVIDGTAMMPRDLVHAFRIYRSSRLKQPLQTLRDLRWYMSRQCRYERDPMLFGRPDVWLHPEDFEVAPVGDCEDHALYAWVQLLEMGYDAYFTCGRVDGYGHAWVMFQDSGLWLYEATSQAVYPADVVGRDMVSYEPHFLVDGALQFRSRPEPERIHWSVG